MKQVIVYQASSNLYDWHIIKNTIKFDDDGFVLYGIMETLKDENANIIVFETYEECIQKIDDLYEEMGV